MQTLRLSGPATPLVKVPPIKSAASKQIGTRPKLAALVQCIVAPRMTPPLPSGGVAAGRSPLDPLGVDKTLASGRGTSVGEYETHPVVSNTWERRHRFIEARPSAIREEKKALRQERGAKRPHESAAHGHKSIGTLKGKH